jgi:hypothetical protein
VLNAVQAAVSAGQQFSIRGGGHCYADFVYNPAVQMVIDMSMMNGIYFDPSRNAFAIEGGATLGDIYEALYRGWGVTLPGGHCPTTGIGGHATGGGHGMLSRKFGLITDFIEAVEMVTVNAQGKASVVTASRNGANSDLWWAISGGGGGNFGVITRYWFRSPSVATTSSASQLLPAPPTNVLLTAFVIPWASLTQAQFTALITNMGNFLAANSSPTSPYTALSTQLTLPHVSSGSISLTTVVDATVPNATTLIQNYHTALTAGTGLTPTIPYNNVLWLSAWETINSAIPLIETNALLRNAVKSAFLVEPWTPAQIAAIYANLTTTSYSNTTDPALLQIGSMAGGQISAVPNSATAISYRNAIMLAFWNVYWPAPSGDAANIAWLRTFYSQVFASTGGVPDPANPAYQGCCINLPDPDMADTAINTSGVPWQTLYYGSNYARLQTVKAKWDPENIFQHPMSITAS